MDGAVSRTTAGRVAAALFLLSGALTVRISAAARVGARPSAPREEPHRGAVYRHRRVQGHQRSLGHAAGDELLRHVAACLNAAVRPQDVVARLGGDEFTVLLTDVSSSDDAMGVAQRIHLELQQPPPSMDPGVAVNASIGVVLARPDDSPDSVLTRADTAMYEAKRRGKGRAALLDLAA